MKISDLHAILSRTLDELSARKKKDFLHHMLHRFVIEAGKKDEFLAWVAKDMGLDKPFDFAGIDAAIESEEKRLGTPGQETPNRR